MPTKNIVHFPASFKMKICKPNKIKDRLKIILRLTPNAPYSNRCAQALKMDTEKKNFMAGKHWIIVLIIIVSSYGIYTGVQDLKYGKEIWTDESRGILIEKCMEDSKDMAVKYRELTFDYCVCSTEKIQTEFTQEEYI